MPAWTSSSSFIILELEDGLYSFRRLSFCYLLYPRDSYGAIPKHGLDQPGRRQMATCFRPCPRSQCWCIRSSRFAEVQESVATR